MTTGTDLQTLGIKPGPRYKAILDHLLEARLNGVITQRRRASHGVTSACVLMSIRFSSRSSPCSSPLC
jgi:hypothetical protein